VLAHTQAKSGDGSAADGGRFRENLRNIFANIAGAEKISNGFDLESDEVDVQDLITALRRDSAGDGSLAKMLNLPGRITAANGSRDVFETVGPGRYCSPCHRMSYNSITRIRNQVTNDG
jgi:hypothetical protein